MGKRIFFAVVALLTLSSMLTGQQSNLAPAADGSSMTYYLVHPLHKIEATSKTVEYHVQANPETKEIRSVTAAVDVTTFDSGNSSRDSHAMEVIDAITYPEASFSSTSVTQQGDSLRVAGKLTFHGVTKDIVISAYPGWSRDGLEVRGGFELSLAAFNVERPALLLIPVEDTLRFSFIALFRLGNMTQRQGAALR
jgi:polyisoprenoid-binding protein YceI